MDMLIKIARTLILALLIILPSALYAAGGGGGGGGGGGVPPPPPCDNDTWTCSDWATCQLDGTQSRTCELTFDCPVTQDPKPATNRTCTPTCTEDLYSCTNWSSCDVSGKQRRTCGKTSDCPLVETQKPIEIQNCEPSCTADTWTCSDWNTCANSIQSRTCTLSFDCPSATTPKPQEGRTCLAPPPTPRTACQRDEYECTDFSQCNEDGRQTRTCTLKTDCPSAQTPEPVESRVCPGLRCGQLPTLKDRISCRLELSNQELATEFKILYAPEACRALTDHEEKTECIRLYQQLGPCWQISVGSARNACAKKTIGLDDIAHGKSECAKLKNAERAGCLLELKEKVQYLIVFRMYDLEVRAETLLSRNLASTESVVELETFIETKKIEMYSTLDTAEWKRIISEVQKKWREFVMSVRTTN